MTEAPTVMPSRSLFFNLIVIVYVMSHPSLALRTPSSTQHGGDSSILVFERFDQPVSRLRKSPQCLARCCSARKSNFVPKAATSEILFMMP
jgi:hypothetical protein